MFAKLLKTGKTFLGGLLCLLFLSAFAPLSSSAQESLDTGRVHATFQDNGDWELTDTETNVTWYGQWISSTLMKVTGTDNSCFVIGENETGMVQLDCKNLRQISILLSYNSAS